MTSVHKKNITANTLQVLTWEYLKVNSDIVEIPEIKKTRYGLKENNNDEKLDYGLSNNKNYGVSQDALSLNKDFNNLNLVYKAREDQEKDLIVENLSLNNENKLLFDDITIVAEKNSKISILLDYNSLDDSKAFRNSVLKLIAKDNSQINIFLVQRHNEKTLSLASLLGDVYENAEINIIQVEIGSKKTYTNYKINLLSENAKTNIDTIYFGEKNNNIDISYHLHHLAKKTNSKLLINGALKDKSRKIFKGSIDFKKGSSMSRGSEEEFVTLLDDGVSSIAVPLLLCDEDNVEGLHAASAGKIDEDILFFIMSRGLSYKEAKKVIVESKLIPTIDKIPLENLRKEIWEDIDKKITN